jgi:hypothetical protein
MRDSLAYCLRRRHLRRTLRIALVVGIVLTLVNQGDVIVGGDATAATGVKMALNFMVPFIVSNLGLLGGRRLPEPSESPTPVVADRDPEAHQSFRP